MERLTHETVCDFIEDWKIYIRWWSVIQNKLLKQMKLTKQILLRLLQSCFIHVFYLFILFCINVSPSGESLENEMKICFANSFLYTICLSGWTANPLCKCQISVVYSYGYGITVDLKGHGLLLLFLWSRHNKVVLLTCPTCYPTTALSVG